MNRDRYESLQYDGKLFNEIRKIENEKQDLIKENKQLKEDKKKAIEKVKCISFTITTKDGTFYIRLRDLSDGQELLEILGGINESKKNV